MQMAKKKRLSDITLKMVCIGLIDGGGHFLKKMVFQKTSVPILETYSGFIGQEPAAERSSHS
jgi:hypothetical protein